jgi:hypothetical protein
MGIGSARFQFSTGRVAGFGVCIGIVSLVLFAALLWLPGMALAATDGGNGTPVRLPGHVLRALTQAAPASPPAASQSLTLTFVLKRDDETGFQQYLHDVYDPASPIFRQFLTQAALAQKFGPSQQDYAQVLGYLQVQGFQLAEGSANRMTLTVSGSRAQAEQAFGVHIGDYRLADRSFYANDSDPALPKDIADRVETIAGLSNLASPRSIHREDLDNVCNFVGIAAGAGIPFTAGASIPFALAVAASCFLANLVLMDIDALNATPGSGYTSPFGATTSGGVTPPSIDKRSAPMNPIPNGAGQKIGLVEFDNYLTTDVADYIGLLTQVGIPVGPLANLSKVDVNGGTPPGAQQSEVLLDIDTVLTLAPGASVVVYDAPFSGGGTSFQSVYNAMINGGVTIISNSWAYCEDQTTLADVSSIDSILQNAAAAGISVFNGAGDSGGTCLDGSANTVAVPADSPHATAVGGTSLAVAKGYVYGGETYWNGAAATQPTGQGGFGISRFFARPAFQNGLDPSAMRSIPDVAMNADPAQGFSICQASAGGCPTGLLYGGTSVAAPIWASFAALLNQTQGHNLGALNPSIYPLADTSAFHSAGSMASDFAHVGLGSPNIDVLHQLLSAQPAGLPSATVSKIAYSTTVIGGTQVPVPFPSVPADGTSEAVVVVALLDANGNSVSGKMVALAANSGSHAAITPAEGVSSVSNGAVVFAVADSASEPLTLTATDATDHIALQQTVNITFAPPPAASGSIVAFTDAVVADGHSTDTITVTLQDARGLPSPGKLVTLQQTGNSVISGPNPSVTNNSGQIAFTVTDTVQETVTYTATDVTDGNLPAPGSASVTFSAGGGDNCGITNLGNPDIGAGSGYTITPFATGFVPLDTNFGGLIDGCRGASGLAFDATGHLYVSDLHSGNVYKFAATGGVAGAGTLVTPTALGPGLESLAFGHDGKLYGAMNATTGNFFTGAVIEINPTTGAQVRTVATSITCASFVATDPISDDLFVNDSCAGAGSENGSVWRISNPSGTTPTTTVYASTPGVNGGLSFAPGGTLYMLSYRDNGGAGGVVKISGTSGPSSGQVSVLPGITAPDLGIVALGQQSNGDALSVILAAAPGSDGFPLGIRSYDTTTNPVSTTSLLMQNGFGNVQIIGPDGCMYVSMSVAVYRVANADGSCPLNTNTPLLALSPAAVSPNPVQGGSQNFTATFHNTAVPAGTAVTFQVSGANAQVKLATTDANGHATFNEAGVNAGNDAVIASATVGSTTLTSNPAQVTWNQGPHTTFLSLNNSPSGADAGKPIALVASLVDVSVNPAAAIAGATIQFTIAGRSCNGVTNASGVTTCSVTLPAIGAFTLNASFAGNASYLPASASQVMSSLDLIFADGFEGTH